MRGIILAGGTGSRLWPITHAVSKHLVPVFDKPMIYYPLSTLVSAGIREILVVTTPRDQPQYRRLLGDGGQWGLDLRYAAQPRPEGIAQALTVGADFLAGGPVALILGDNLFHGPDPAGILRRRRAVGGAVDGALVFACPVPDQRPYGVVRFGPGGEVCDLVEKPAEPGPGYAVPGLYVYDREAVAIAAGLTPGPRGELEITDVNRHYLRRGRLAVRLLGRDTLWLDTGTVRDVLAATDYVRATEERRGVKVGCVEEAAWRAGFIGDGDLRALAGRLGGTGYGDYLRRLADRGREVDLPVRLYNNIVMMADTGVEAGIADDHVVGPARQ